MLTDPNLLHERFNALTRHGTFATIWKHARCVPIRKTGRTNLAEPKSLRPISRLSCLGKTFEKILTKRIPEAGKLMSPIAKKHMQSRFGLSAIDSLLLSMTQAQEWLDINGRASKNSTGSNATRPFMMANDLDGAFKCVYH
ncbi:hypothetical protein Q9L58_010367 [Maublancomyces gigas]|uniref:Uncharacterized protein n=1 Tax=Discina gigas TaxID=1032678 RepID=A0ABR3G4I5_9PEZI